MRRTTVLGAFAVLLLSVGTVVSAADGENSHWTDMIRVGGDLRLRAEHFDWKGQGLEGDHRDRFRYRLRVKMTADLSEKLEVGFQLRSGNPANPHSDNQSFDGGFDKDKISISEAYVRYKHNDLFEFLGGKFAPKKLWLVSDLQWDDDVVAEGAMQNFHFGGSGALKAVEANTYQFIVDESGSGPDAYIFGVQVRPVITLNDENQLTLGVAYDSFSRPDNLVDQSLGGTLNTEPEEIVTNIIDPNTGMLVSDFRILTGAVEWKNKSSKRWPIKASFFYYVNTGAESGLGNIYDGPVSAMPPAFVATGLNPKDNDTGYFARIQVGDYKKPGQVAVRVSRYDSKPDAIYYAWVQSDTRRGSNVDGHRVDLRVGMPLKGYLNLTWYNTDWKVGASETMDRYQLDYIFKF